MILDVTLLTFEHPARVEAATNMECRGGDGEGKVSMRGVIRSPLARTKALQRALKHISKPFPLLFEGVRFASRVLG